ncbi:uncharacterized protein FFUJ_07038 [Fusarium fujikuroi IMI 58289]|uniref:Uncharacterized protein n=1 Tax=Gibberella fujikuroi (strain CBS 195.34 / IMI 58289 / NRRL A-6831) TaxID=1279085 RepID=S0E0D2_GIBF5|nr:uncharacterized protein FFUJ_07038 [Fusarium fujikuroi IMI 58289]CCT68266.1 uncharacterized protein FFUJ_07038 [Fusarium fujikuroi IMI 58289]SCN93156.1 uncharacterized protein FFM5_05584 [Fusarium fujikuroi]
MSLSKQDMKYFANGKVITEEALIAIAAAKRDDFEKWCGTRQFQHFLMRARLGSLSGPMTLPRLQNWAADEMFHLRSLEESQTHTGGNLVQGTTSKVPTKEKNMADVEEGPHFVGDDLIAFA